MSAGKLVLEGCKQLALLSFNQDMILFRVQNKRNRMHLLGAHRVKVEISAPSSDIL